MKKLLTVVLVALIVLSLAACSGATTVTNSVATSETTTVTTSETTASSTSATTNTSNDKTFKVGYNYFGTGAYSLTVLANNTQIVANAFGDSAVAMDDQFSIEKIVSDVENMATSGCAGINIWLPVPPLYTTVADICAKNKVFFSLNDKVPADKAIKDQIQANPYFAGGCAPDNALYGTKLAEYAIAQGWKTCIITAPSVGDPSDQPRLDAFTAAFTKVQGNKILVTLNASSVEESLSQISDALATYGEVDFIYGTGSDYAINANTALESYPNWKTKIITSGLDKLALGLLNKENSRLVMVNGDNWVSGTFSALILRNALVGNTLKDADGKAIWIDNLEPFEVNAKKFEIFEKYMMNQNMFTDEEMKSLVGCTYDQFMTAAKGFNLDERLMAKFKAGIISADEMKKAGYNVG